MKILLTGAFDYSEEQKYEIEQLGYEVTFVQEERQELGIDASVFDVVVCNQLFLYNKIENFKNLKMIQLTSAGLDRVPVEYVKKHNIELHNAKGVYSVPIAEWVVLKILEIYKKSKTFYQQQRNKEWIKHRDLRELTGKNVAILGFGSIGQEIMKRLLPFNVNMFVVDIIKPKGENKCKFIHIDEFAELINGMDVVVLTLPLTDDTKNYFDGVKLSKLKEDAILINVSRGSVVSEQDLTATLKARLDITAVLDVFEKEPLTNDELWELPNAIITPHNAYVSEANNARLYSVIKTNLSNYIGD